MKAFFTNMRSRQALTLPNGEVVSLAPMRYYLFPVGTRTSGIEGLSLVTLSPARAGEVVDLSGAKEENRPTPVVAPVVVELEERGKDRPTKGLPFAAAVSESLPNQDAPKPVPVLGSEFVPRVPNKRQKP